MNASDLKARVLAAAQREPSPPRNAVAAAGLRRIAGALIVTVAVFAAVKGVHVGERPLSLLALTAFGAAAIATVAAIVALARGRSMLGRSAVLLWSMAVATPVALLAWKLTWTARFDVPGPTRLGLRCLGLSFAIAAAPLLVFVAARRQSDPLHPTATGAAAGAAVGAMAWVLVDLWCPAGYLQHLVIGHVLPLTLIIVVAAAGGRRWIAVR